MGMATNCPYYILDSLRYRWNIELKISHLLETFTRIKMTYIDNWEEFAKAAEQMYLQDPSKARFVTKYRHCDGKLVLKMTNDKLCLKYRTDQQQDLKRIEKLNNILMRHMTAE